MQWHQRLIRELAGLLAAALLATAAAAQTPGGPEIREWKVPYPDSRPRDPAVAPDGSVWFVGQVGDYLARLDPATGEFARRDLPDGTGPHNLIVDDDGVIWYAGNRTANIGRYDPDVDRIETIPMPDPAARDPHTLIFAPDGNIWFTLQGANRIGHLDTATRKVRLIEVPTPRARPYGIVVDGEGRPWVNLLGTHKLATVDPDRFTLREIDLPREDARSRRIALARGGVWYVDYSGGYLGRYDPDSGRFQEWRLPSGAGARPYAMAADGQGRLWAFETGVQPNRLVGFDPARGQFFASAEVPSGGGTVRHMVYDPTRDALWFGTDTNTIGRARLP